MSKLFSSGQMNGARAVGVTALAHEEPVSTFRPRFGQFCSGGEQGSAWKPGSLMAAINSGRAQTEAQNANAMDVDTPAVQSAPVDLVEQARADGFAQGFDEGMRIATDAASQDDVAVGQLADALASLAPAATEALPALLSAAVMRLVEQIVGKAAVDVDLLKQRVAAVAAFVEEEQARKNLHLHPDDIALLTGYEIGLPVKADASMARGSVRLDSGEGWIEDGPDVQLSRLKAMLNMMEDDGQ